MSAQPYESTAPEGAAPWCPRPSRTPGRRRPLWTCSPPPPPAASSPSPSRRRWLRRRSDPQPAAPQDFGAPSVAPAASTPPGAPPHRSTHLGRAGRPRPAGGRGRARQRGRAGERDHGSRSARLHRVHPTAGLRPGLPRRPACRPPRRRPPSPSRSRSGETPDDVQGDAPSAKRFLGMQLRRPRRGDLLDENVDEPGPSAPVAAWPTDVGVAVVATAEPAAPVPWGPPAEPADSEPVGLRRPRPRAGSAGARSHRPPSSLAPSRLPPSRLWSPPLSSRSSAEPVVAAEQMVSAEPRRGRADSPARAVVAARARGGLEPVATPVPVPAADDELRALRTPLEASDARRVAAEQRADNAVAYAQQLQAELTGCGRTSRPRLQAAEYASAPPPTRPRTGRSGTARRRRRSPSWRRR